jgi:MFS family permease
MRAFYTLWTTQTLSLFGTFVTQFAVNIWLTQDLYPAPGQKAALALGLSATTIAFTAPMIFGMPLAGAFADRHDRRRILIAANAVSCALTLGLVALVATRTLTLPIAAVLLAGYSLASGFHSAAFDSSLPMLAPSEHLPRANGMMMSSYALSQVLSPALAATLIGVPALVRGHGWPLPWIAGLERGTVFAFAADAATFAIAGVAVALMRIPQPVRPAHTAGQSLVADVREGFLWIAHRRPFLWLIAFGSLANLMLAPLMLFLPLLVRDRMRADWSGHHVPYATALATVTIVGGVGGVLGGVVVSLWGGRVRRRPVAMIVCIMVLAVFESVTGLARTVWLAGAALFAAEFFVAPLNTMSVTLWQTLTPPHMLARAMSTRRFIAQSFFPLGTFLAGWLAVPFDPAWVVAVAGALLAVACASQLLAGRLTHLEDRMREAAAI